MQLRYAPKTQRSSHTRTSPQKTPFGSNDWRASPNPFTAQHRLLIAWSAARLGAVEELEDAE